MKKLTSICIVFLFLFLTSSYGQMYAGQDTLYGNEWIDYDLTYYKIELAEDGFYRINYQELVAAGVLEESAEVEGTALQLYHLGRTIPIYTSTAGVFGEEDYITFYGKHNDGILDRHLYPEPEGQLSSKMSMFTDTSAYFLSIQQEDRINRFEATDNQLSEDHTKIEHCWQTQERIFSEFYSPGRSFSGETSSRYDIAEGFFGGEDAIRGGNRRLALDINTPSLQVVEENAQLELRLFGRSSIHRYEVLFNGQEVLVDEFTDWAVKGYKIEVPTNILEENNDVQIQATANSDDKFYFSSYTLFYPTTLDAEGKDYFEFELDASEEFVQIEIRDFEHRGTAPILYDLKDKLFIRGTIESGSVKYAIPPSFGEKRKLVVMHPDRYKKVANLKKRKFIEYPLNSSNGYDYIILTHPKLYQHSSGVNYVEEYHNYRQSLEGGSYKPIIVDVTQLYDQFGYGVKRHEQSIKNFLHAASQVWNSSHLLLLGKGVDKLIIQDEAKRIEGNWDRFDLVPTFGFPHSDYLFVMTNEDDTPWMAVGRVAAYNSEQLRAYLKKVKEFEAAQKNAGATLAEKAWMKRFLHFAGGDALIQNQVRADFTALQRSIENSTFGGDVEVFFKTSVDIVQEVPQTQKVRSLINEGAAMIVFYGHSSAKTLDFDIGAPEEYDNKGRYPIFYAIGCNTNTVFSHPSTLSEDYIFIEDKGTVGFFGSTSLTQLTNLSRYARGFYRNFGTESYGKTVGEIIRETIIDYEADNAFISQHIKHVLMFHGDPALKIYPHEYPDFTLNAQQSKVSPDLINARLDSFQVQLNLANIGRAVEDSVSVTINQILPNNQKQKLRSLRIHSPKFSTTLDLALPIIEKQKSVGRNQLEVIIDTENSIEEGSIQAEANNTTLLPFFVIDNDIRPVYPSNYGIVKEAEVTLKASSTNIFSGNAKFYLEIDTVVTFDSSVKRAAEIEQSGGVLSWKPPFQLEENTVYYWRVSIDSTLTSGRGFNWQTSSFVYLPENAGGWNQSHFQQLDDNNFDLFEFEERTQVFTNRAIEFSIQSASFSTLGRSDIAVKREGFTLFTPGSCSGGQSLWVGVFDPVTLKVRRRGPEAPEPFNCFGSGGYVLSVNLNRKTDRARIADFFENNIREGDYVIAFTTKAPGDTFKADEWAADSTEYGTNIFQAFEANGARLIRNIVERETSYIFVFQKGDTDFPPIEEHARNDEEIIQAKTFFTGRSDEGSMKTAPIGPANAWNNLLWDVTEQEARDSIKVDVFGVDIEGKETLLYENIENQNTDLSSISASQYPYLKLRWKVKDRANLTPPQLEFWRVTHELLPEIALTPNLSFTFRSDTLQKGEEMAIQLAVSNIGEVDVDSVSMRYTLIDSENLQQQFDTKEKVLKSQDTLLTDFKFTTAGLKGKYQLLVEVNPEQIPQEQFFFNNSGAIPFFVEVDERNPLLDVTFDGARIMNGDIVASKPQIVINLRDENQFLALNDTSLMKVGVLYPSGELRRFHFNSGIMEFFPADENNLEKENIARIEFQPIFTESGTYQLQLLAEDRVGNQSGDFLYTVDFEVITESQISNVFNYPNPFSTSTQFVFTLTGSDIPEDMHIQIMTVSGRVVREISMAELGNVRIGNNRSQFKWDGTDEFGDRLANGVYLYRVMVKGQNDVEFEKFDNNTDQYFEGGIGKMVIIR
ncbi:MAG: C25 family cysteine peptidase [Bacteroidota bacterium]